MPRHVLFAANQAGVLPNGVSLPTPHIAEESVPQSRFHVIVLVVERGTALVTHEQLVHIRLGASRIAALQQSTELERKELRVRRECLKMLQQVELVAEAGVALHAIHQITSTATLRAHLLLSPNHVALREQRLQLCVISLSCAHLLPAVSCHRLAVDAVLHFALFPLVLRDVDVLPAGVPAVLRQVACATAQRALVRVQDGHGVFEAVLVRDVAVLL